MRTASPTCSFSYDELNGALVSAEDRFKSTADELQLKQNTIMKFLDRKRQVDATLAGLANVTVRRGVDAAAPTGRPMPATAARPATPSKARRRRAPPRSTRADPPNFRSCRSRPRRSRAPPSRPRRASWTSAAPSAISPDCCSGIAPAPARSDQPSSSIRRCACWPSRPTRRQDRPDRNPADGAHAERSRRTASPSCKTSSATPASIPTVRPNLKASKASAARMAAAVDAYRRHRGRRLHQCVPARLGGAGPDEHAAVGDAPHSADHAGLGPQFERTSGFGARIDPFTGRYSFHPGIDFAGPWGSTIARPRRAPWFSPGDRGGYGNMVEIDHGFGIHTRYGHMSSILVQVGAKVSKGSPIGRLGSTGRSTGPHVHYEVWYDDVVRNPSTFIEAGRHVFQ